ncbi:hypothetical protein PWT90_01948 [Aphanocladium album]|nr:hypothetical protein PWT90_01948 [Aphanocladium album]
MEISVAIISLLSGACLAAAVVYPRQEADDDLEARVAAIEQYLARPDRACVKKCNNDQFMCEQKCLKEGPTVRLDYTVPILRFSTEQATHVPISSLSPSLIIATYIARDHLGVAHIRRRAARPLRIIRDDLHLCTILLLLRRRRRPLPPALQDIHAHASVLLHRHLAKSPQHVVLKIRRAVPRRRDAPRAGIPGLQSSRAAVRGIQREAVRNGARPVPIGRPGGHVRRGGVGKEDGVVAVGRGDDVVAVAERQGREVRVVDRVGEVASSVGNGKEDKALAAVDLGGGADA